MTLTQVTTEGIKAGTITGSDLATNVDLVDNQKLRLGTSQDLEIYHDGTHSYISEIGTGELRITTDSAVHIRKHNNENIAKFTANGSVELHHDNTKRFETDSNGCTLTGTLTTTSGINAGNNISMNDNIKVKFGTGDDLQIYHDGTDNRFDSSGLKNFIFRPKDTDVGLKIFGDGAVELYFDNGNKLQTISTGVQINGNCNVPTGDLQLNDNRNAKFGDGGDLVIVHNGTNSIINNDTGDFFIQSDGNLKLERKDGGEDYIHCIANGAVELHHDGNKKLETLTDGVNVTGTLKVNGSAFTGGKILQVINAITSGSATNTDNNFQDSGLEATITPSSTSSKILVIATMQWQLFRESTEVGGDFKLVRSGSGIATMTSCVHQEAGTTGQSRVVSESNYTITRLDSPSTTSATTYKVQFRVDRTANNAFLRVNHDAKSVMTLLEVSA